MNKKVIAAGMAMVLASMGLTACASEIAFTASLIV